jgi:bacterioferritin-associated ferredoxin
MYVCICHAVTDRQVRTVIEQGARSVFEVQLPVGSCCGRCQDTVQTMVDEHADACDPVRAAA